MDFYLNCNGVEAEVIAQYEGAAVLYFDESVFIGPKYIGSDWYVFATEIKTLENTLVSFEVYGAYPGDKARALEDFRCYIYQLQNKVYIAADLKDCIERHYHAEVDGPSVIVDGSVLLTAANLEEIAESFSYEQDCLVADDETSRRIVGEYIKKNLETLRAQYQRYIKTPKAA